MSHIFTKLGVTSRSAATAYAYDHGYIGGRNLRADVRRDQPGGAGPTVMVTTAASSAARPPW